MTDCIKTGARVLLTDYDVVLPADIYYVDGSLTFIFNMALFHDRSQSIPRDAVTHTVTLPRQESSYFWHKDKGILVIPVSRVTFNVDPSE